MNECIYKKIINKNKETTYEINNFVISELNNIMNIVDEEKNISLEKRNHIKESIFFFVKILVKYNEFIGNKKHSLHPLSFKVKQENDSIDILFKMKEQFIYILRTLEDYHKSKKEETSNKNILMHVFDVMVQSYEFSKQYV